MRDVGKKGWRSILLLGAAYGIIEEGILVRSFFNPQWKDLGVLSTYGRWLGVNWVWAEWLAIYHAIFSITIPIFLVEQYYSKSKGQIWLTKNLRILFHSLLVASIVIGFYAFPYDAPLFGLIGCVIAVFGLGWLAKKIPNTRQLSPSLKLHWRVLALLGFSVPAVLFFLFNSTIIPVAIVTIIVGALAGLGIREATKPLVTERMDRSSTTWSSSWSSSLLRPLLRSRTGICWQDWFERCWNWIRSDSIYIEKAGGLTLSGGFSNHFDWLRATSADSLNLIHPTSVKVSL